MYSIFVFGPWFCCFMILLWCIFYAMVMWSSRSTIFLGGTFLCLLLESTTILCSLWKFWGIFLNACKNFLLFCMDGPSRDIDHLKRFIEYLFWFWTRILDSLFSDFEYLSLLFISAIFLHCGQKPRIPWRFKCLLHCGFPFILHQI